MSRNLDALSPLQRYSVTTQRAAGRVIDAYSTSFGAASQLLGRRHRPHIRNIYALVRVADELVDGVGSEAGLTPAQQQEALDRLIEDTHTAMRLGYSSNPVVHAFALTARAAGIDAEIVDPFFASMRADLRQEGHPDDTGETTDATAPTDAAPIPFDADQHRTYVYGSAEVVGLMCLRVFTREERLDASTRHDLEHGARQLGAAFQNVNFLRDLADDTSRLGRSYLSDCSRLTDADRQRWVDTIRGQLDDARRTVPLLPSDARLAVSAALGLFAALTDRIATTPTRVLYTERVRLSAPAKVRVLARAVALRGGERA